MQRVLGPKRLRPRLALAASIGAVLAASVGGCLQPTEALLNEEELLGTEPQPEAPEPGVADDASAEDTSASPDVSAVDAEAADIAPGDAAGPVDTTDAEGDVEPAAPVTPTAKLIVGHWMNREGGDCAQTETWLTFQAPDSLGYHLVDRSTCGQSSVSVQSAQGKFSAPSPIELSAAYERPNGDAVQWRRTFALVDYLKSDIQETPEGYIQSKRAQNHMAYVRSSVALEWTRVDDEALQTTSGGLLETESLVTVRLSAELTAEPEDAPCAMTIAIATQVQISADLPPSGAFEQLILPCTMGPIPDHPLGWYRVTGNGFEDSFTDSSWAALFQTQGLFDKYPSQVTSALMDAFRPVLYYRPADPSRLFHDVAAAWFFEMYSTPPDGAAAP